MNTPKKKTSKVLFIVYFPVSPFKERSLLQQLKHTGPIMRPYQCTSHAGSSSLMSRWVIHGCLLSANLCHVIKECSTIGFSPFFKHEELSATWSTMYQTSKCIINQERYFSFWMACASRTLKIGLSMCNVLRGSKTLHIRIKHKRHRFPLPRPAFQWSCTG